MFCKVEYLFDQVDDRVELEELCSTAHEEPEHTTTCMQNSALNVEHSIL